MLERAKLHRCKKTLNNRRGTRWIRWIRWIRTRCIRRQKAFDLGFNDLQTDSSSCCFPLRFIALHCCHCMALYLIVFHCLPLLSITFHCVIATRGPKAQTHSPQQHPHHFDAILASCDFHCLIAIRRPKAQTHSHHQHPRRFTIILSSCDHHSAIIRSVCLRFKSQ